MEKKQATKTYIKVRKGERLKGYTNVPNHLVQTKDLSFRAKGLLIYFMSLPSNYYICTSVITRDFKLGKHVYYETIKELKSQGYLEHTRHRDKQGRIMGAEYIIYESSQPHLVSDNTKSTPQVDYPDTENQDVEYPDQVNQNQEKQTQYNKYKTYQRNNTTTNNFAAADLIIKNELTLNQLNMIRTSINNIAYSLPYNDEQLFNDVVYTILDETSFSKAEGNFQKKLNSILKVIRQGMWVPPAQPYLAKEKEKDQALYELQQKLSECRLQMNHWKKVKQWHSDSKNEVQVKNCEAFIEKEQKNIQEIEFEINKIKIEGDNESIN